MGKKGASSRTLPDLKDGSVAVGAVEQHESIGLQVVPPFMCAGMGMVLAGLLLESAQRWPAFVSNPELFVMVPALLGLKGNLEMTLASRLSTLANCQGATTTTSWSSVARANLALVQAQGITVGAVAAALPMAASYLWGQNYTASKGLLLLTSSVATASIASFLLGLVMLLVITVSSRLGVNPDNVATPIAASLGDLVTLGILSFSASAAHSRIADGAEWEVSVALAAFAGLLPLAAAEAARDRQTREILKTGWTPVLAAMFISSAGGKILEASIAAHPDIASYQPVINGVAGNLVAVQASRISTHFHRTGSPGGDVNVGGEAPECSDADSTARFLLSLVVPGHLALNFAIAGLSGGRSPFDSAQLPFLGCYLASSLTQVGILLWTAERLVVALWRRGIDPDNAAIPYLTAAGDLLGGAFLAATFHLTD